MNTNQPITPATLASMRAQAMSKPSNDLFATEVWRFIALLDTITAQSRLLALAETLVGSVKDFARTQQGLGFALNDLNTFTAALTEYHANGAVLCGECEAKREVLRDADKRWAADRRRADRAEEERDDLRRQLEDAERLAEKRLTTIQERNQTILDMQRAPDGYKQTLDDLRRQLAEAQKIQREDSCCFHGPESDAICYCKCHAIRRLEADNADLVGRLLQLASNANQYLCDPDRSLLPRERNFAFRVSELSATADQPHPGAPLLDVVNAASSYLATGEALGWILPDETLDARRKLKDALDAIRNREGR